MPARRFTPRPGVLVVVAALVASLTLVLPASTARAAAEAPPAPITLLSLRVTAAPEGGSTPLAITRTPDTPDSVMDDSTYLDQSTGRRTQTFASRVRYPGTDPNANNYDYAKTLTIGLPGNIKPGPYRLANETATGQARISYTLAGTYAFCGGLTGTLRIHEATYNAANRPTVLAADFDSPCENPALRVHGTVRWNSAWPVSLVDSTAVKTSEQPTPASKTDDTTVTYTAVGNAPVLLGRAELHEIPFETRTSWSILTDECSGARLAPGMTCRIVARFAPLVPNGFPTGSDDAWITIPDGLGGPGAIEQGTHLFGVVTPLPLQPLYPYVEGAFRRLVIRWDPPEQKGPEPRGYRLYRVERSGERTLISDAAASPMVISGLPDGHTATFQVSLVSNGVEGPLTAPITGTTSSRELIHGTRGDDDGVLRRQLDPMPTTCKARPFLGADVSTVNAFGPSAIAVSRNQATLAFDRRRSDLPDADSKVVVVAVDGATGALTVPQEGPTSRDVSPAVSPDGTRVVYTHSTTDAPAATVLRIVSFPAAGAPVDVVGSEGLSDATFSADGSELVAVRTTETGTELVRIPATGGMPLPVLGGGGATEPDVGPDGRIAATIHPSAGTAVSSLVMIDALGTVTPVAGATTTEADSSENSHPIWSRDGALLYFVRSTIASYSPAYRGRGDVYSVVLQSGLTANLTQTQYPDEDTGVILEQDGTQPDPDPLPPPAPAPALDSTAPTVSLTLISGAVLSGSLSPSWTGADPDIEGATTSELASFDARYRAQSARNAFGSYSYPAHWQGLTTAGSTLALKPGYQYCVSVRARDHAGNTSSWTPEKCVVTPLDDRSLTTKATRRSSTKYYLGTYSYTKASKVAFTRTDTTATRVGVVASTCSTCGSVTVYLAGKKRGTISLVSTSTKYRQVLWLSKFAQTKGTLELRTTSSKAVSIDGVVTER